MSILRKKRKTDKEKGRRRDKGKRREEVEGREKKRVEWGLILLIKYPHMNRTTFYFLVVLSPFLK